MTLNFYVNYLIVVAAVLTTSPSPSSSLPPRRLGHPANSPPLVLMGRQSSLKSKKWTEEERTLINKYAEMASDGSLCKMKTWKKFRPIAAHVNAVCHCRDPITFPWQSSWKDASTKVQNMQHQYLLLLPSLLHQDSPLHQR